MYRRVTCCPQTASDRGNRAPLWLVDQSGGSTDTACSESLVDGRCSMSSVVAAQLASRFRASCVGDPGSAV